MIALVGGLVVATLIGTVAAWFLGSVARSKALGVLVWLALMPTLALVPVALAVSEPTAPAASFSHAQLEADRVMTQQMGVVAGPGMDAQMTGNGMLQRSANPGYVAALERHIAEFDRMAGLRP